MENHEDSVENTIDQQTLEKLIVKAIYRKSERQRKIRKVKEQATIKKTNKTGTPVAIGSE